MRVLKIPRRCRQPSYFNLVFAVVCMLPTHTGCAQSIAPPEPPPKPISGMHLMTASTGWVWKGNHLLWTKTAGRSWSDITPQMEASQSVSGVYFFDELHAWVALRKAEASGPDLFSVATTSDGARSWSVAPVPDEAPLEYTGGAFDFVDEIHGWLLLGVQGGTSVDQSKLYTTVDGGATWSALPQPPINGDVRFFSDGTGWLAGGVHRDELYLTRDSGRTWSRKVMALPKDVQPYTVPDGSKEGVYTTHPTYIGPHFSTEKRGLLLVSVPVSEQKATLLEYITEDGGNSWKVEKVDSGTGLFVIAPPAFFDSSYIEVGSPIGARHAVVSVRLNSEVMARASSTYLANSHSLVDRADFVDSMHGWPSVNDGSLLGTSDGGKSLVVLLHNQ